MPSSLRCVYPIADDVKILCFETGFKTSVGVTSTPSSLRGRRKKEGVGGGGRKGGKTKESYNVS